MRHWCVIGLIILLAGQPLACHAAVSVVTLSKDPNLATLKALLTEPENRVDLAQAEVMTERMIDPTVKPAATLHELDAWADRVRARISLGATNMQKLVALNTTLYLPGPWNDNRAARTNQALNAGGVPTQDIPFPGGLSRGVGSIPGAQTFFIPQGGPIPEGLMKPPARF